MNQSSKPFNPILTTAILCDISEPGPDGNHFVGFFYNNSDGDSFIITNGHCLDQDTRKIYPRFRSVSDPRGLSRDKVIQLWEDGRPVWRQHPITDLAAIPLKIDVPDYSEGIIFDEAWPHEYLKRDHRENATVHHDVYCSAFTNQNIPGEYITADCDYLPFAGDEVSVITYDKTKDMYQAYSDKDIIKHDTFPKIRRLTISTPYHFDYFDKPTFLTEGRQFIGSSGGPVVYIPPSLVYSEKLEARNNITEPILAGIHTSEIEPADPTKRVFNLYKSVRSEEIIPLVEDSSFEWDTTPDC